jgi:manganese transport protein
MSETSARVGGTVRPSVGETAPRAAGETVRSATGGTPAAGPRPAGRRPFVRDLFSRELLRYLGPGFVVTIGFIDPGNWATNIAGGSEFGYQLLWVISVSTLMLIFLQHMAARLGIVTGRSLAVNIRRHFTRPVVWILGGSIVPALIATSLAEILGGALGFQILFGIPLWIGALMTLVIVVLAILGQRYESLERLIMAFLAFIAGAYVVELFIVRPDMAQAAPDWVIPSVSTSSIVVAMGMLGAIVMPHNIYLHSNTIQSRDWDEGSTDRTTLMRFELIDTTLAMGMGWLVNSSMILVAAAVFFANGVTVTSITQASETLAPLAGSAARLLFGLALLVAGVSSSITSSLASTNVVCGYLGRPEDPHSRVYRVGLVAMAVPAVVLIIVGLDAYRALILSQVVLSVQLPFTIVPLLVLSRRTSVMRDMRIGAGTMSLGIAVATIVIGLNVYLLYGVFFGG